MHDEVVQMIFNVDKTPVVLSVLLCSSGQNLGHLEQSEPVDEVETNRDV